MRYAAALILALLTATALSQSTNTIAPNSNYTITSYPLYGALVTPSDSADLATSGAVRADTAGQVKVTCHGNNDGATVTLTLAAGEFVPCVVKRVYDTDTDAINLHVFY